MDIAVILQRARALGAVAEDQAAQAAYFEVLRQDPSNLVVFPPRPEAVWEYRRGTIADIVAAATRMTSKYADPVYWVRRR